MAVEGPAAGFSLWRGGPAYRLARTVGLVRGGPGDLARIGGALLLVGWAPLLALGALADPPAVHPLLRAPETHARWVLMVPLLLVSLGSVDTRARQVLAAVRETGLVDAGSAPRLAAEEVSVVSLRSWWLPEAVAIGLVVAAGVVGAARADSAVQAWMHGVSLPLVRLVTLAWLWGWLLWARVLGALAALELGVQPGHPDGAGGTRILTLPSRLVTVGGVGLGATLSAALVPKAAGLTPWQLGSSVGVFAVLLMLIALGPLLPFARPLWQARLRGWLAYDALVVRYVRAFEARRSREGEALVDAGDVSGLADLAAVHARVWAMRLVPFDRELVVLVLGMALVPFLPLLFARVPVTEVLRGMAAALFG